MLSPVLSWVSSTNFVRLSINFKTIIITVKYTAVKQMKAFITVYWFLLWTQIEIPLPNILTILTNCHCGGKLFSFICLQTLTLSITVPIDLNYVKLSQELSLCNI